MCASWLAGPEECLAVHVSLDGGDHCSADGVHDEQSERQAEAHNDSEQDGAGWIGRSRLDAGCHGIDCIVEDGPPNIAGKRLHGVEAERSSGERCDCFIYGWGFVARLVECRSGNGRGGQDERYNGS